MVRDIWARSYYGYGTGPICTALSTYLGGGGANITVSGHTVQQTIEQCVSQIQGAQFPEGHWSYYGSSGYRTVYDLSVSRFSALGLSAAEAFVPGATDSLARFSTNYLPGNQDTYGTGGVGGFRYGHGSYTDSYQMTAAGLFGYRMAGRECTDSRVQQALGWLQRNYSYMNINSYPGHSSWDNAYFYYLWGFVDSVSTCDIEDPPAGIIVSADIGGVRDPEADGHPEEDARWYYDFSWRLLSLQNADGFYPNPYGSWNSTVDHCYALLTLSGSTGNACLDEDEDDICEVLDNCPVDHNPGQEDVDDDDVGDVCDNCPDDENNAQDNADAEAWGEV